MHLEDAIHGCGIYRFENSNNVPRWTAGFINSITGRCHCCLHFRLFVLSQTPCDSNCRGYLLGLRSAHFLEEGLKLVAKGGQDDVIRNIVVGSYHAHGENHGRKVVTSHTSGKLSEIFMERDSRRLAYVYNLNSGKFNSAPWHALTVASLVWRRDAMAGENEVLIYYWDDRDGSSLAGWWIAPTIGGDEVDSETNACSAFDP
eukprot:5475345-Amphidinium_carterae.1